MKIILLDRDFDPGDIEDSEELDIRNVGKEHWPTVLRARRLKHLVVYHITSADIPCINSLGELNSLSLTWATKVKDISSVFLLTRLEKLTVSDFPKLRSITGIEELTSLKTLNLSGSMGSLSPPLQLGTIAPVSKLSSLETLSLQNARLDDDNICALSQCRRLKRLVLSNQFEKQQFAFLAKHLNSQLEEPIRAYRQSSLSCKTCGAGMFLITGKRQPILCRACSTARFMKAEESFARLVTEA